MNKQSTRGQRIVFTMLLIVGIQLLTMENIWLALVGGGLLGVFTYEVSP